MLFLDFCSAIAEVQSLARPSASPTSGEPDAFVNSRPDTISDARLSSIFGIEDAGSRATCRSILAKDSVVKLAKRFRP